MSIRERLSRLLPRTAESQEPVQMGVVKIRGRIFPCVPTAKYRGVKLVTASPDLMARYDRVTAEFEALQFALTELPTSLRPRVRRAAEK